MRELLIRLRDNSAAVVAVAAVVQCVTAIVIVWLTSRLTRATADYAKSTKDILDLNREQDSRALLANWHLSFVPVDQGVACLKILNLSRNSARVTHLFTRVSSENETDDRTFPLDLGMPSGAEKTTGDVSSHILEAVNQYCTQGGDWDDTLEIGILFQLAEYPEPRPSARFSFRAVVHGRHVVEITSRMPFIAGDLGQGE